MTWASAAGRVQGAVYDFGVRREWLARPAGRVLWGTDVGELYASIRALGDLPAGASVLDVPCGGGVALRGLVGGSGRGDGRGRVAGLGREDGRGLMAESAQESGRKGRSRPAVVGGRRSAGVRYVGVDISGAMVARTRRRAERLGLDGVELVAADVGRLPFADGVFDVCVCFNGLHCLSEPAVAVRELARCLRRGGRLVGDMVVSRAGRRQDLAIAALRRAGLFGTGGTAGELRDWLAGAGLRVERLEQSGAVVHFAAVTAS
ncbi:MAG TPA: class I SAM-dependent methyltransferase [Actinophytocola sp.]|nr:class I SAM-dependent methyltransferase [Actinophytocola sp.]